MDTTAQGVLVGIDGTGRDAPTLAWAADAAACRSVPLHVLYALPPSTTDADGPSAEPAEALTEAARSQALARHPDLVVQRRVIRDNPTQALVDLSVDALVVVVGSRGLGPIAGRILGSVSQKVAGRTHCPLVVVRDHAHAPHGPVVAEVDPRDPGTPAVLAFAFEHAAAHRLPIVLVHTLPPARTGHEPELHTHALEILSAEAGQQHADMAGMVEPYRAQHPEVPVDLVQSRRDPHEALLNATGDASMIVLSQNHGDNSDQGLDRLGRVLLHKVPVIAFTPGTAESRSVEGLTV